MGQKMRERWMVPVMLLTFVAGSLGVWAIFDESAISFPKRICRDVVPSENVAKIFPRRGDSFKEEQVFGFDRHAGGDGSSGGSCHVSAGGEDLVLEYHWNLEQDVNASMTKKGINEVASMPGNGAVSLGSASGYIKKGKMKFFLGCPYEKGRRDVLEMMIGGKLVDSASKKELVNLADDYMVSIVEGVLTCQGKVALPESV